MLIPGEKIRSLPGYPWSGFNRFTNLMVCLPLPGLWHCTDCWTVTPGNRAAAVVGGFNVIVFATIAVLAHREKLQKKRNHRLENPSTPSELNSPTIPEDDEKKVHLGVKAVEL